MVTKRLINIEVFVFCLILGLFFLTSCKKDDDIPDEEPEEEVEEYDNYFDYNGSISEIYLGQVYYVDQYYDSETQSDVDSLYSYSFTWIGTNGSTFLSVDLVSQYSNLVPFGEYVHSDEPMSFTIQEGYYGALEVESGSIVMEETDGYHPRYIFDLVLSNGKTLKGEFVDPVSFDWD